MEEVFLAFFLLALLAQILSSFEVFKNIGLKLFFFRCAWDFLAVI
jgi:hypothetical protein